MSFPTPLFPPAPPHRLRDGDPLVAPLILSTTFARDGIDSSAPHRYSRESNPTVAALERALGELDGGDALAFSTGLSAETTLLLATVRQGDHVLCGRAVYGGTTRLLQQVFAALGVKASFVDATDPVAVERALQPNTKLLLVESPANPTLTLCDITALAAIARARGVLLAVDNTFLTPVLQRPLDLGADIAIYSTTKFIDGHSTALGGALTLRNEPLRERLFFLRKCIGTIQSPFQAWLTLQGLKTLPLRLERQSRSAQTIAFWLADHPAVQTVHYPSLPTSGQLALAERQHRGAHGAVVSFELRGGLPRAKRFVAAVRRCVLAEHVGSVETLLTHPATMTHGALAHEQRLAAGISDALLRLSVGLETPDSLIDDLDAAIAASESEPTAVLTTRDAREEVASCPRI